MLIIQKATLNELVLTLSELKDESLPNDWLLVFVKDQGEDTYRIFLDDLSGSPESYQLFNLLEGTDLTFTKPGDYSYKAYQMPDRNDTDESRGILVEQGKMRVKEAVVPVESHRINTAAEVYER